MAIDIPTPQIGYTWTGYDSWRSRKLVPYVHSREGYKCKVCYRNSEHIHEGIITRGDVQGWQPKERRVLIFHPYNCIALCAKHHNTELEPTRYQVFVWNCEYYGKENVIDWLSEISKPKHFKIVPPIVRQILKG